MPSRATGARGRPRSRSAPAASGTESSRRSSVGSSAPSVDVQRARPARKPDAPPRHAAATAAGKSSGSTPCERTTHGHGSAASIARARRSSSAGSPRPYSGTWHLYSDGRTSPSSRAASTIASSRSSSGTRTTGSRTERSPCRRGQLDEAARHLDAVASPRVVAPDHEQLQRHHARRRLDASSSEVSSTGPPASCSSRSTARISPCGTSGATAAR